MGPQQFLIQRLHNRSVVLVHQLVEVCCRGKRVSGQLQEQAQRFFSFSKVPGHQQFLVQRWHNRSVVLVHQPILVLPACRFLEVILTVEQASNT